MKINNDNDLDLTQRIEKGLRKAVANAINRHKLLGQPIAIWQDNQVKIIPADQIDTLKDSE